MTSIPVKEKQPNVSKTRALRFASFLRAFLHVVIQVGIHVRRGRGVLLRAFTREVTFLLANAARRVLGFGAVAGEMSFGAAVSALVLVARLATALTFRSSVRLRAISRPVTGLVTSVAHVILASRLGCARRAWRPATRRIVATRAAAGAAVGVAVEPSEALSLLKL